jgi:hypothetical protein
MRVRVHQARQQQVIRALHQYAGAISLPRLRRRQQIDDFAVVNDDRVIAQDEIVRRNRYAPAGND